MRRGAFIWTTTLADGSGFLEIATTRQAEYSSCGCQTMNDYSINQRNSYLAVSEPWNSNHLDEYVEQDFGTGVVKITPAHDPNDFEVGNRHQLPRINVMNDDATMNELTGKYEGMDRFVARKLSWKDLERSWSSCKNQLLRRWSLKNVQMSLLNHVFQQWFVKMGPLAETKPSIRNVKKATTR